MTDGQKSSEDGVVFTETVQNIRSIVVASNNVVPMPGVVFSGQDEVAQIVDPRVPDRGTVPLPTDNAIDTFPVDKLPPLFRDSILELSREIESPIGLIGMSAISVAAFAVQQHVDTLSMSGSGEATSIFTMTVAESGERKTASAKAYLRKLHDYAASIRQEREIEADAWQIAEYKVKQEIADLRSQPLPNADARAARDEGIRQRKAALGDRPWRAGGIVTDVTAEALYAILDRCRPSALLETSEAGGFFGGFSMRPENMLATMAWYTRFWDGDPVSKSTLKSIGDDGLTGRRLSLMLSGQPSIVVPALRKPELMGQGFLARVLLSFPPSTQGQRMGDFATGEAPFTDTLTDRFLEAYKVEPSGFDMAGRVMPWAEEALAARKVERRERVEPSLASGGDLAPFRALGNRILANASRLATIFAFIDTMEPEIGTINGQAYPTGRLAFGRVELDHWRAGIAVAWYSFHQWRTLLSGMKATTLSNDGSKVLQDLRRARERERQKSGGQAGWCRGEFSLKAIKKLEVWRGLDGASGEAAALEYVRDSVMPYLVERGQVRPVKIRMEEGWTLKDE